jgi:DNA-binding MarR family transcriptional regulator
MKNMSINKLLAKGDLSKITTYQAGVMQASMHRKLQKYCDRVLKPHGLTKMQWLIIGTVLDAGKEGVRLTELSEKLNTTMSYITNAVNLLESRKILSRQDSSIDSRSKLISIDKTFAPKCAEIERRLRDALRSSIYAHVDPDEFRTYMKVLYQLSEFDDPKLST